MCISGNYEKVTAAYVELPNLIELPVKLIIHFSFCFRLLQIFLLN